MMATDALMLLACTDTLSKPGLMWLVTTGNLSRIDLFRRAHPVIGWRQQSASIDEGLQPDPIMILN